MIINGFWFDNARLRILNGYQVIPATPTWATFPDTLQLGEDEMGICVGFQQHSSSSAGGILELQILYNDTAAHEGYFRTSTTNAVNEYVRIGNQQPTTMPMVNMYVPPSTLIGLRARFAVAGGVNLYLDLYVVTWYRQDTPKMMPVCFPAIMPQV